MKLSKLFLAITIILVVLGTGIVAAEETNISDYSFTIPDGYRILESGENTLVLENDSTHVIVIIISDEIKDLEDTKKSLAPKGYTFIGNDTYTVDGNIEVQQQNYQSDEFSIMAYVIDVGDEKCIITFTIPINETAPEGDDNPVTTIIKTIE